MLEDLEKYQELLSQLNSQIVEARTAAIGVRVDTEHEQRNCFFCRIKMNVQKTVTRIIYTLKYGSFVARETVMACQNGCRHPNGDTVIVRSEKLAELAPPGANFGYDIEVFVGKERFLNHAQREEIQEKLQASNIDISTGTISALSHRFLAHLEELHYHNAPKLRVAMEADGGYPMHIDATTEDGKGTTFAIYSGWRRWVLGSWKIPTERADYIEPHIQAIVDIFGEPISIMRDLGRSMKKAVIAVAKKMTTPPRQLVCHYHFLSDVGCGLLNELYGKLRAFTRQYNVRENLRSLIRQLRSNINKEELVVFQRDFSKYITDDKLLCLPDNIPKSILIISLAQWILEYKQDSNNTKYPFSRPYVSLHCRCHTVNHILDVLMQQSINEKVLKQCLRLQKVILPFIQSEEVSLIIHGLNERIKLFDYLRTVFKLESDISGSATAAKPTETLQNTDAGLSLEEIESRIKQETVNMLAIIKHIHTLLPSDHNMKNATKIVIDHLDRHWQYLWGHHVRTKEDEIKYVERTNNLLEGFFKDWKHSERRRSGRKNLGYDFENTPASSILTTNLLDDDYVKLVCGTIENLPFAFSQLDQEKRIREYNQEKLKQSADDEFGSKTIGKNVFPNNKNFVRNKVFNQWIHDISTNSSNQDIEDVTIMTALFKPIFTSTEPVESTFFAS